MGWIHGNQDIDTYTAGSGPVSANSLRITAEADADMAQGRALGCSMDMVRRMRAKEGAPTWPAQLTIWAEDEGISEAEMTAIYAAFCAGNIP